MKKFFRSSWINLILLILWLISFVNDKLHGHSVLVGMDLLFILGMVWVLIDDEKREPNPWLLKSKRKDEIK